MFNQLSGVTVNLVCLLEIFHHLSSVQHYNVHSVDLIYKTLYNSKRRVMITILFNAFAFSFHKMKSNK